MRLNTTSLPENIENILMKLRHLPKKKIEEVEDFIDFLSVKSKRSSIAKDAMMLSEKKFNDIWNNKEDAAYDKL